MRPGAGVVNILLVGSGIDASPALASCARTMYRLRNVKSVRSTTANTTRWNRITKASATLDSDSQNGQNGKDERRPA
jgi:hypothetical protein